MRIILLSSSTKNPTLALILSLSCIIIIPKILSLECSCEPPEPEPKPISFQDVRLAIVYPIIQQFKTTITTDPLGITQTWVGPDICNYKGLFCDHPPDDNTAIALASIDFNGFGLTAPTLYGFIDRLPDLALFHANSNNFSGTISEDIAKLQFLYEIDLSNNKFCGSFPASVLSIAGLTFLDIRFNLFTGTVPPQVFKQRLNVLFINDNNFVQRLPDEIGSTPAIYLTFANNKFTGPIPRSIGNASSTLVEVLFLNNKLTGCIPYELGLLRNATVVDAGNNLLTGPLPCSLACLEKVEQLNFAGNLLYGQLPEGLCGLRSLLNLSLSHNYFTYVGPICKKLIKSGVLDVRKNCIRDLPNQRSPIACAAFFRHPKYCPYSALHNIIPCKLPPYHKPAPRRSPPKQKRRLLSYSALERHRK